MIQKELFKKLGDICSVVLLATLATSCGPTLSTAELDMSDRASESSQLDLDYEHFELDNGLKVILHQDLSDPIVAIATVVHVGSSREKPGRTGFAHFFEHMAFNDSENVPKGANRKMIPELGGSRNGGTWTDGTIYYEVVPKDAFDKLLWIDSDRFGYMINTVKQATLEREKQVVKNERRERYDNSPYGLTREVIVKSLYPEGHPYNWTTIGDLKDLQAATLEDVKEFYAKYYVPANATLVIAGDIDMAETRQKVQNWFGEIKAGPVAPALKPQPVSLSESKRLYHLDNFAQLPELRLTFPTIHQYHPDAYALSALAEMFASGKDSALYKEVVAAGKLAPGVSAYNYSSEIAGSFTVRVRANANQNLDAVYQSIDKAIASFETEGFSDQKLQKYKAEQETSFYYGIESILDKALQMGQYNEFAGSPDFLMQDIDNITSVKRADIERVFKKYIKNQPAIITSFVPKAQPDLVLSGSQQAVIEEEKIVANAEPDFVEEEGSDFAITPTNFDRSEPPLSALPKLTMPAVWRRETGNGIEVLGIEQNELPLVNFRLRVAGGQLLDPAGKTGTGALMAALMNEGTATKTPQALAEAIGLLGASLSISSDSESITVAGNSLVKNFDEVMSLLSEMILEPRWDAVEFERLKKARLTAIKQAHGNASGIALNALYKKIYGAEHVAGTASGGTEASVANLSLQDLKDYYARNFTAGNASFQVVGDIQAAQVEQALKTLSSWRADTVALPGQPDIPALTRPNLYFIDLPGAKQSAIFFGKAMMPGDHPEHYPLEVANQNLGGGVSARLTQTLRIEKGYSYGARSVLTRRSFQSPYIGYGQVRSNVTFESMEIFRDLINNYRETYFDADLAITKNKIIKGNARRFETLDKRLGLLDDISRFGFADNYVEQQQAYVENLSLSDVHQMVERYLQGKSMTYVVVGDAASQLSRMADLGLGEPILLDLDGNEIRKQ